MSRTKDESILSFLVGQIYELDLEDGFWLLEKFVFEHPESIEIIRVYLSELWARIHEFDKATNEARIYLRQLENRNLITDSVKTNHFRESIPRAILLLTSAYTELGARSYSIRALSMMREIKLSSDWKSHIEKSIQVLLSELKNKGFLNVDQMWENFFSSGENYNDLKLLCNRHNYSILAKRLELIYSNFMYDKNYKVDESELLSLVIVAEDNVFYLS